ncbi:MULTISPECIES: hypothetical protein [Flavobacterium]|uniref:Lipocalin-like domain-containing protein n=1 Tax=Flavobacterium nitrogenifigens TaxID=1617283 RepID=A0A521AG44_9FLAO|nr:MULTISPECIES: hypothetical protein [Flavobacterium]KAF2331514.1 hypothetical protein DM397_12320 [Flavobacterium nitrogenifigens]WDF64599.1 hypothetical protein PQ463_00310 [Flavobacterium sp. KACC 22763]SMO33772.1 hypothetical protein SAMN06265220_101115 [Flavobacterium nitrogenifigens]
MNKLLFCIAFLLALSTSAQTSKELIGKWQLVKWTKNGKEKSIEKRFKTDQVFQVFKENGDFESVIGDELHKAKWKLSNDNSQLTIISVILPVVFTINSFDSQKRVITNPEVGTFEYKKVAE